MCVSLANSYSSLHFATCRTAPLFASYALDSKHIAPGSPDKPLGRLKLFNDTMKRKVFGEEEVVAKFQTEEERVRALMTGFAWEMYQTMLQNR